MALLFGGFVIFCGLASWNADVGEQHLARQLQTSGVRTAAVLTDISFGRHGSNTVVVAVPTTNGEVLAPLLGRTDRATRGPCGGCYRGTVLGARLDVVRRAGDPVTVMAVADMQDRARGPVPVTGLVMAACGSALALVGLAAWWWPVRTSPTARTGRTNRELRAGPGTASPGRRVLPG